MGLSLSLLCAGTSYQVGYSINFNLIKTFIINLCIFGRTVDLVILGYEVESLKLYNFGDELERCFKLLQKRDETFTRIQHWENCFESGPQLCLKIHFLFLHLIAGKDIFMGSYGFWNVFFIVVGIFSCAWKNVCNRKSLNLCSDQEKRMSWRKHIIPLFIAHSFSVCKFKN